MAQGFIPVDQNNIPLPSATAADPNFTKLQSLAGTTIDPATAGNQTVANSSLAAIATNTSLGATATKQPSLGLLGTPSNDVLTVQGGASMYPLTVAGTSANVAAGASNPFPVLPYASPGVVAAYGSTNGDALAASANVNAMYANSIVRLYGGASSYHRAYTIGNSLNSTGTGVAAVAIAPAASQNITSATTTTVKSSAGMLSKIIINTPASGSISVYDSTSAGGTKLATLTTVASANPVSLSYDIPFGTGLTLVTSATMDITVTYR